MSRPLDDLAPLDYVLALAVSGPVTVSDPVDTYGYGSIDWLVSVTGTATVLTLGLLAVTSIAAVSGSEIPAFDWAAGIPGPIDVGPFDLDLDISGAGTRTLWLPGISVVGRGMNLRFTVPAGNAVVSVSYMRKTHPAPRFTVGM